MTAAALAILAIATVACEREHRELQPPAPATRPATAAPFGTLVAGPMPTMGAHLDPAMPGYHETSYTVAQGSTLYLHFNRVGRHANGGGGMGPAFLDETWMLVAGCGDADDVGVVMTGGDPARGRAAIRHHGCIACHAIPGAGGQAPRVAPPLDDLASRTYLAGHLPNTPANLVRWIRFPQDILPGNAMPDMQLGEPEARDIAAYLYTLRSR